MKLLLRLRAVALLLVVSTNLGLAETWDKPAADLAKAIAATFGKTTITVSVNNASSIAKDQVPEIQQALESQLRTSGIRTAGTAPAQVRVTLSENLRDFVWVAEIRNGSESQIRMVSFPKTPSQTQATAGPRVTLHKALLLAQHEPILDAYILDSASPNAKLFVLDAENITSYVIAGNAWKREQSWSLVHNHPFPRDLRGLMMPSQSHILDAYLPGTVCELSTQAVVCRDSDDPWKLSPEQSAFFNSSRNYFTGAMVPSAYMFSAPFYSAAWIQLPARTFGVFTGLDGRVHASDRSTDRVFPATTTGDWGSDIAAVKSGCGIKTQLLVTSTGDDTQTDTLRAFEINDGDPVQVSASLGFPGPIMALWTHDSNSTIAVSHNLQNGNYEAYSVSVTCNQ